ncbi:MAG: DUF362 domain-containing protein [Patescibacteria group bacterium]
MKSKVYFIKLNEVEKIRQLLPKLRAPVGIKVHFGEEGNVTYMPASTIKPLVEMINNPTFIECNVLYKSPRTRAATHKELAINHGFDYAPIDILDGEEGDEKTIVKIKGEHFNECYLGKGIEKYNSILAISHFKGHISSKFGGALKNIGMGLASRQGKLAQHASIQHVVNQEECNSCGTCIKNCPEDAIQFNEAGKAEINAQKCIGCSKCIAVCPEGAVGIPWESTGSKELQERIAEYALATATGRECYFINFLINITKGCDCMAQKFEKLTEDIGIMASADPVAIDQASYDRVVKHYSEFKERYGEYQLKQAEELGLGSREYELIEL